MGVAGLLILIAGLLVAFDPPDRLAALDRPDQVGRLGLAILPLARQAARTVKAQAPAGAVVMSVERFGPAGKAGVRVGDIIVRVNGLEIRDGSELTRFTVTARTGSVAVIEFLRNGELRHAALTVGKPPANKIYV